MKSKTILEKTNDGLNFYKYVIPDLIIIGDKSKSIKNPFYNDTKASFNIYKDNGQWKFKDFGDKEYSGDVFKFASYYYNLDCKNDFPEILSRMITDLELQNETVKKQSVFYPKKIEKQYTLFEKKFLEEEINYFSQYGISIDILERFKVIPIDGFKAISSEGKSYSVKRKRGNLMFAYKEEKFAKIYLPNPKKFWYVGDKPNNFCFGFAQISKDNTIVFLTGGEKDVMTLHSLGYDAISLNSETCDISSLIQGQLSESSCEIIILYDMDETGVKNANKLAEKYNYKKLTLPHSEKLKQEGGKDISDYIKLGFSKEDFHVAVNDIKKGNEKSNNQPFKTLETSNTSTSFDNDEMENNNTKENSTIDVPLLFPEINKCLPPFLEIFCSTVNENYEKDLLLLGSLTVLSNCLPNIEGIYGQDRIGANIYLFVVAPPSAGKGILKYSRVIAQKIHQELLNQSDIEMRNYRIKLSEYEKNKSKNSCLEKPIEPPSKRFFIPANSSAAAVLNMLSENEGRGIIFETEADTLSYMLAQDWGNYSDNLRKAYHHEPISYSRKMNKENIEIGKPFMSILF